MTAFGLSASAGLNAYIPLLIVGVVSHYTDWIKLNPPFDLLGNPWILILVSVLLIIEMLADKIPAVNHINDIIQTVIRPAAGAIVFAASAQTITDINPLLALGCGIIIGGSVHVVKSAAVRPAITATTGGTANVPVSIAEDLIATITSILAIVFPILVVVFVVLVLVLFLLWLNRRLQKNRNSV